MGIRTGDGGGDGAIPTPGYNAATNTPDLTTAPPTADITYYVTTAGSPDMGANGGVIPLAVGDRFTYVDSQSLWIKLDNTAVASEVTNDSSIAGATVKDALDFPVSSDRMDVTSLAGDGLTANGDKLEVLYDAGDFRVTSELDTNRYGGSTGAEYFAHWNLPFLSSPWAVNSTGLQSVGSDTKYWIMSATPITIPAGDYYFAAYRATGVYAAAFSGGTGLVQTGAVSVKTLSDGYRLWKFSVTTSGTATQLGLSTNLGSEEVRLCNGDPEAARLKLATVVWAVKAGAYTAVAGDKLAIDTSSAAVTITLPASPTAGDSVEIKDYAKTWDTTNGTVARNGSLIEGDASDLTLDVKGASTKLTYIDATKGWIV